jgi:hypothetical protein
MLIVIRLVGSFEVSGRSRFNGEFLHELDKLGFIHF